MTTSARPSPIAENQHAVRFYESDRSLAVIVADFLDEGFGAGQPAIIVASAPQRAAILRELGVRLLDVVELQRSGDLVLLDAVETLSTFMVDGKPDEEKFRAGMCQVIDKTCEGRANCVVRIYGQMVDVLWQNDEHEAAIRLEMLWNQLAQTKSYSLLCGYAMGNFYKDAQLDEVCRQHTHADSDARGGDRLGNLIPGWLNA